MLIYQAGVAKAFALCESFMGNVRQVLGTSGGACVGVLMLACPSRIDDALEAYSKGTLHRGATFADVVDPSHRLLPRFVTQLDLLPLDAHEIVAGRRGGPRLSVHVTPREFPLRNVGITDFANSRELLTAVQASCCLHPRGVTFRGRRYVDGGLSDSIPVSSEAGVETITISPFCGEGIDVCPGLTLGSALSTARGSQDMRSTARPRGINRWLRYNPSIDNATALMDAAVPRGAVAHARFAAGVRDGERFLQMLGYRR